MRVRLGFLLTVVGGGLSFGVAEASAALGTCDRAASYRSCGTLTVPLDRSGAVPGTVKLRIERQKAKRSARPPLFLIADPGESATETFDSETVEEILGTEVRSRDIVVMDQRGTGRSGALSCPTLQRGTRLRLTAVADCAAMLGPRRDFYASVDIADDIDAVRAALGAERIAIFGSSYGTYVAQAYARRYPARVDRLVLDSVVGPTGVDALRRSSMAAVPGALESICGKRACRSFARDPGMAVARLAARLDRRPLNGYVVDRHGRRRPATIDGRGLLELFAAFPLSSTLPGAVAAASRGDSAPLLRARAFVSQLLRSSGVTPVREHSVAAYVAALCSDTALPWSSATPAGSRRAPAEAFVGALPDDAFAPFGKRTALASDVLEACVEWPSSSRALPEHGPVPDVPALLLAGGADVNTPVEDAQALQTLLPRSELLVVHAAGHDVIQWEENCAGRAVRRFLAGGVAGRCGRAIPDTAGVLSPPPPTSLRQLPRTGAKGRPGRTVTAVQQILVDGLQNLIVAAFLEFAAHEGNLSEDHVTRVGALRGGSFVSTKSGFLVRRALLVPGVRVSGRVAANVSGRLRGTFKVRGRAAAHGRLTLRRKVLRGTLGGRAIRVRFPLLERAFGIPARDASLATRRSRHGHTVAWWGFAQGH